MFGVSAHSRSPIFVSMQYRHPTGKSCQEVVPGCWLFSWAGFESPWVCLASDLMTDNDMNDKADSSCCWEQWKLLVLNLDSRDEWEPWPVLEGPL